MKLVVVSSLEHFRADSGVVGAWPAAVREIDALASLFDEVVHVACLQPGAAPAQARAHEMPNVRLELLPPAGAGGWIGKLDACRALPARVRAIQGVWRDADAALVRCPSNVAAAALLLMSIGLGPARRWVKYTGAWRGRIGEGWSHRLQRAWLRSGSTGAAITVGGVTEEPGCGAVTLCNPSLSLVEAQDAERATLEKNLTRPWRLIMASRLTQAKGVGVGIRVLAALTHGGHEATLDIAGDGPHRGPLEALARSLGVHHRVIFHGWVGEAKLDELYARSHVLLAPSRGEGWSRAWTDAAARRCTPVVSDVGEARGLQRAAAGLVLATRDPAEWAVRLETLLADGAAWRAMADRGPALALRFTYERFLEGARLVLRLDAATEATEVLGAA